jgi:hypothetical protein
MEDIKKIFDNVLEKAKELKYGEVGLKLVIHDGQIRRVEYFEKGSVKINE